MISSSAEYTNACHKYYGVKRAAMEYGIDLIETEILSMTTLFKQTTENSSVTSCQKLIIQMVSSVVLRFHH